MRTDFQEVYRLISANDNLTEFFRWYLSHCESLALPYHNLHHTLGMMWLVNDLYKKSQFRYDDYGFKIKDDALYVLMLSAMFHDYNHSGGKFTDDINVKIAQAGLKSCFNEIMPADDKVAGCILKTCCDVIAATEYPYVIPESELNLLQKIIRELDILVDFYDDFITHNIIGLHQEIGSGTTLKEFTSKYISFTFDSINGLNLVYSKELIDENRDDFLNALDKFSAFLKNEN